MPTPRHLQVDVEATPYYHCICRCVRRAYLCGEDRFSGRNFDHRKRWIVDRLAQLEAVFAIDVCAYAVMSNHLHLVLRIAHERTEKWSEKEVLRRAGRLLCRKTSLGEGLDEQERHQLAEMWRHRLGSLSWFMRYLNEAIARRANKEDDCTGRFWEGRFRSQALLDFGALLTCMTYVDLNPVRAGVAASLDEADFTSIQQRLREAAPDLGKSSKEGGQTSRGRSSRRHPQGAPSNSVRQPRLVTLDSPKHPYRAGESAQEGSLPLSLEAYTALLSVTGQAVREGRREATLQGDVAETVARAGLDPRHFIDAVRSFALGFHLMVGHVDRLGYECRRRGIRHTHGVTSSRRLYAG